MYRMSRRSMLIAGAVAALLLGVGGGVAVAASPYRVHVKVVPNPIPLHTIFKIKFKGVAKKTSMLLVLLNVSKSCATTAANDVGIQKLDRRVRGSFLGRIRHFSTQPGQHRVCVYLTALSPSNATRAHAGMTYTTLG